MFLPHVRQSAIEAAVVPGSFQPNFIAARLPDQFRVSVNQ